MLHVLKGYAGAKLSDLLDKSGLSDEHNLHTGPPHVR